MQLLTDTEKNLLVQIRLLIARAAQQDSLIWWEDNSLTPAGGFMLEKAFVFAPEAAGRTLGLQTAHSRYENAFQTEPATLHLFRLEPTGELEHSLHAVDLMKLELPASPVSSLDELRQQLLAVIKTPPAYQVVSERADHRLEIRLRDERIRANPLRLAQVFAWASLEGKPGYPLFPYLPSRS